MTKKYLEELAKYIWVPFTLGLLSYIFFQLHDIALGLITLFVFSATYTVVRLYLHNKRWWLLVVLACIIAGAAGYLFTRSQGIILSINGQGVTGSSVNLNQGSVSVNPGPGPNGKYAKDTAVTLTATPAPGYDWKSWSGTDNDTSNPTTVTMSSDKQVKVTFEPRFSLIINNQLVIGTIVSFADGSVSVYPAPGDDSKYTKDAVVTLTAIPAPGYDWKSWSGTDNDASNPTTVTMSGNKQETVTFEPRFSLFINNQLVIGSVVSFNEGSVSVNPAPGTDDKYAKNTIVTLTATPALGYGWKGWAGTSSDTSNPATVTISSDKHVVVTFEPRFQLTINNQALTGSSVNFTGGSVSVNPAPGTDGRFAKDSTVTLTATPASGYRFDRWSGDASGTATPVNITMNSNKSVTAIFVKVYNLTTSVSSAGGGSVSPGSGTYDEGTTVILTATPASGYRFDHWEGDVSGTVTPTNITINSNKSVTAVFVKVTP